MSMTISASLSMRTMGKGNMQSYNIQQYDRLSMQKQQILSNKNMPQKKKDMMLQKIEDEQNSLMTDIDEMQKKQEAKKKAMTLEQKAKYLSDIYDSETAKSMLKMDQLVEMSVNADTADKQSVDELQDVMDEVDAEEQGDGLQKSVNQVINEAVDNAVRANGNNNLEIKTQMNLKAKKDNLLPDIDEQL